MLICTVSLRVSTHWQKVLLDHIKFVLSNHPFHYTFSETDGKDINIFDAANLKLKLASKTFNNACMSKKDRWID